MTKPKGRSRRLGWRIDDGQHRRISQTVAWLDAMGEDEPGRDLARGHYLQALSERDPRVLADLTGIDADDQAALKVWGRRWVLTTPWALWWARATIR